MIQHETSKLVLNEILSHSPYVGEFESIGFRLQRVVKRNSSADRFNKGSEEVGDERRVIKRRKKPRMLKTCNAPRPVGI